ncbi:hypothetical protein D3C87_1754950 [compost metagenome]
MERARSERKFFLLYPRRFCGSDDRRRTGHGLRRDGIHLPADIRRTAIGRERQRAYLRNFYERCFGLYAPEIRKCEQQVVQKNTFPRRARRHRGRLRPVVPRTIHLHY